MIIGSEFCDLYAHTQPIFLLWGKFQNILLKTVEVAKTQIYYVCVYDKFSK